MTTRLASKGRTAAWVFALALCWAPVAGLGWEAEDCVDCHGDRTIVEGGNPRLFVNVETFERTAHAEVGCPSCHDGVTEDHPDDGIRPGRVQCGECHADADGEYQTSVHRDHAACTDCHDPHRVTSLAGTLAMEMNDACRECHDLDGVLGTHSPWLAQAELHLVRVPCITCHTGSRAYTISFYVVRRGRVSLEPGEWRRLVEAPEVALVTGIPGPSQAVDRDGDGVVSVLELVEFNRRCRKAGLALWAMLTPERASHRFDILDDRWDCTFCHVKGRDAAQKSALVLPERGGFVRLPIEPGAILEAIYGSPDFHMAGVTRSPVLTRLGLFIVAAGGAFVLAHGSLRLVTRGRRKREEG
ncbi:cytochrome c3 family protein [Deferrisoma sp.]